MGLKPDEFWNMTFAEVDLACKGYETRAARMKEVPRLIAAILMNVNRKRGSSAIKLEDVFPLYTDKRHKKVNLMTADEFNEVKELRKKVQWQSKSLKRS